MARVKVETRVALVLVLSGFVAGVVLTSAYHADLGWRVWATAVPGAVGILVLYYLIPRLRRGDSRNHCS